MPEQANHHFVCPLVMAGVLDSRFRKLFHNPNKIVKPYIKKGITALDIGCGPGVFSIEIAKLLEGTGKVISVDMQEGMLEIFREKIKGTPYEQNIVLHKCTQTKIGLKERVDFVLMFYMVHEVPDKESFFSEVLPLVNKNGLLMIVEPKLIPKNIFKKILDGIKEQGFEVYDTPKIPLSRGAVLRKN